MNEHTFGQGDPPADPDADATRSAAELTERILDELMRAGHSWQLIDDLAHRLATVAQRMATSPPHESGRE